MKRSLSAPEKLLTSRRQENQHTHRFDTETTNQIEFLTEYYRKLNNHHIYKKDIVKQIIGERITKLKLWDEYHSSQKKFKDKELLRKK